MEDVLGGRTDPYRFAAFLAGWKAILARRADQAVAALAAVDGVHGIVLAGSMGRGEPWPLSDIDLLPIYDDGKSEEAGREIERLRLALLAQWVHEGWWTGLDVGRLVFGRDEVTRTLLSDLVDVTDRFRDDRWYHSLDKGFQGRAAYDPSGLAAALAAWFTEHRFSPPVVQFRLARAHRQIETARRRLRSSVELNGHLEATTTLRFAVQWRQIWQWERWGLRDSLLGRFGTRFELAARAHRRQDLADALNSLSDLDDAAVERRMAQAPSWVWERHDRQWHARQLIQEDVTRLQDARDVLRVCSHYELRRVSGPHLPDWLGVPPTVLQSEDREERRSVLEIDE
ncbi:MAG: nucleotidyltransferase domain-containing protein [Thermomicrobiales bacterium]